MECVAAQTEAKGQFEDAIKIYDLVGVCIIIIQSFFIIYCLLVMLSFEQATSYENIKQLLNCQPTIMFFAQCDKGIRSTFFLCHSGPDPQTPCRQQVLI